MKTLKLWLYFSYLLFTGKLSVKTLQDTINTGKDVSKKAVEKWQSEKLRYAGSVTTDPQQNLDFFEFFKDRKGLWIWEGFTKNVLKYVTGIVEKIGSITAYYFDMKDTLSDSEISRELPKDYEFGLIEGLALIVWLLLKQWGGKEGALLNDGNANIFHLKVLNGVVVVSVHWLAGNGGWDVDDWWFGGSGRWDAGSRVFSRIPV
ncbi:MAG: hypothetical protein PHT88_01025 [Candidatus Moranbacteria bacterium]|nr:hypothetical protein [Candidatus Moranbacteria bacterium]